MAESLKTIEAKINKPVKLLEIAENESRRLLERRNKSELVKQDLKYEGQDRMFAGYEEEVVSIDKWCKLINKRLARFNGFAGKLKEELSIATGKGRSRGKTERRFDTERCS